MKLSVIIPLYNVEAYIERCLQAILRQESYDFDWEIILVDDGSKDATKSKVAPYLGDKIKYYFQENRGAGAARNYGLEKAGGSHIWFVDADDFIEPGVFSKIQTVLSKEGPEVTLGFGYYKYVNETHQKSVGYRCAEEDGKHFNGIDYLYTKPFYLWNLILLKSIIDENNIRFIDGIKNIEDFEFSLKYFDKAKDCIYVDYLTYNYCDNQFSTSREKSRSNLLKLGSDSYTVHKAINDNLLNQVYVNKKAVLYWLQYSILGYFFSLISNGYTRQDCRDARNLYIKDGILKQLKSRVGLPKKFELFKYAVTSRTLFNLVLIFRKR